MNNAIQLVADVSMSLFDIEGPSLGKYDNSERVCQTEGLWPVNSFRQVVVPCFISSQRCRGTPYFLCI